MRPATLYRCWEGDKKTEQMSVMDMRILEQIKDRRNRERHKDSWYLNDVGGVVLGCRSNVVGSVR